MASNPCNADKDRLAATPAGGSRSASPWDCAQYCNQQWSGAWSFVEYQQCMDACAKEFRPSLTSGIPPVDPSVAAPGRFAARTRRTYVAAPRLRAAPSRPEPPLYMQAALAVQPLFLQMLGIGGCHPRERSYSVPIGAPVVGRCRSGIGRRQR
jgi:hypothetical protein